MDLPDHLLEELEYLGDCITSCDKVENFLMMSEYENNLVKTTEMPSQLGFDRRNRRRIISIRQNSSTLNGNSSGVFKNIISQREALRRGSTELRQALQGTPTRSGSLTDQNPPVIVSSTGTTAPTASNNVNNSDNDAAAATKVNNSPAAATTVNNSPAAVSNLNQNNSLKSGNFRTIPVIEEASV